MTTGGRDTDLLAGSATGSIFDLGYRRYDGPRLGRRHAFWVLYLHSLRWTFGIGRGGRAKIAPFLLAGFMLLPALVFVGMSALVGDRVGTLEEALPRPETFISDVRALLVFFVVAQAPELLGRDLRSRTLTLYFSRAMGRLDYAVAKYLALATALVLVILVPQALMLVGMLFTSTDLGVGAGKALPLVAPALVAALGVAALLAGISLSIAGFTPRRAFASGAIAAVLIVFSGAVALIVARAGSRGLIGWVALADPGSLVDGFNEWVFDIQPAFAIARSGVPLGAFAIVALIVSAICLGVLVVRYRRIEA